MSSRLRSLNSTKISFFAFQDIITSVSGILILVTLLLATELDRRSSDLHEANPELERRLAKALHDQRDVEAQNADLRAVLTAAETAPPAEKLESDITRLREQLVEERKKYSSIAEQLASSQSAIETRDRTLGLTDLKGQIERVVQEAGDLKREDGKVRETMVDLERRVASVEAKLLNLRQREGKLWLIPDKSSTTKEPILTTVSQKGVKAERFDHPDQAREFDKSGARAEFSSYLNGFKPVDQYVVFLVRPSGIELFERLVKAARDKGFEVGFDALEEDKDVFFSTPPIVDETVPTERRARPSETGGYANTTSGKDGEISGSVSASTADGGGNATATSPSGTTEKGTGGSNSWAGGGSSVGSSNAATNQVGKDQTDASKASTAQKNSPPAPSTKTAPSSPQKGKSLWQRFLEWIGLK